MNYELLIYTVPCLGPVVLEEGVLSEKSIVDGVM